MFTSCDTPPQNTEDGKLGHVMEQKKMKIYVDI